MSTGEGRPNQPKGRPNGRPNGNKVPDLNEFMHKDNASAKDEQVDVQALISEIRRVPTNGISAVPSKLSSQPSASANKASSVAASSSQSETQAMRRPGNTQGASRTAAPKTASNPSAHSSNANTQARRVSSAASRKRRQQIEARRRMVSIFLIATIALMLIALGLGIFFLVKNLPKEKKNDTSVTKTETTTQVSTSDDSAAVEPETTSESTEESTEPSPTPTPEVTPFPGGGPNLSGYCVVIDAGHQATPNTEQEPMSSSMSGSKDKSAQGFKGVVTGTDESEIDLSVALLLRDYLTSLGCEVYMTRETNDVDISNKERAELAVSHDPDLYIRLFCNAANDSKASGCFVIVPAGGKYASDIPAWGQNLGKAIASATGCVDNGCKASEKYSGLNWAQDVPSFMVRMGYLSNSDDESALLDGEYQFKICQGIAQFISTMPKR